MEEATTNTALRDDHAAEEHRPAGKLVFRAEIPWSRELRIDPSKRMFNLLLAICHFQS
jgi:hypothetical protein